MTDIILLVLKIAILVLLYLFVWLVVRSAGRDIFRGSAGRQAGIAAQPPDVGIPLAAPTPMDSSAERLARRARRASERTMAGEVLDFTGHIDPRLVVEQSPIVPAGVIFPLRGLVTVGRSPHSDIVLDESFVSSTHARLSMQGQLYVVEDLGSTNGTFVNEKQVTSAPLHMDARLRIGETVFRYEE
jgi:hypothetical protein